MSVVVAKRLVVVAATAGALLIALPARAEMERKDAGPGTAPGATAPGTGSGAPGIPPPKEGGPDMQPRTLTKPRSGTDTGTGPTGSGTGGGGAGNPPMPEAGAGTGGGPGR